VSPSRDTLCTGSPPSWTFGLGWIGSTPDMVGSVCSSLPQNHVRTMDVSELEHLASAWVGASHAHRGASQLRTAAKQERVLLASQGSLPSRGWSERDVAAFLAKLASMDANNAPGGVGVGEREGRVVCPLVHRMHFGMAHGMGRSGDLSAVQPKAPGASLAASLAVQLVRDALRIAGLRVKRRDIALLPVATGLSLSLALLAMRRRAKPNAKRVVWSRIDQKSCIKCVTALGLELVVVPLVRVGDELRTDVEAMEEALSHVDVLCAITTTSCFAPRACDDVCAVARACRRLDVPHLVNHAYGVQSRKLCEQLSRASREGRVDAFVSSLDKNFLVPVGGSILARVESGQGRDRVGSDGNPFDLVGEVNASYPGRASNAHVVDVLATLLWLGQSGWTSLLQQRESLYRHLQARASRFCQEHGLRLLDTPGNPISMGIALDGLGTSGRELTALGSHLFARNVSGARVVPTGSFSTVDGLSFVGFGSHHDAYPHPYLTVAAAVGATVDEIESCFVRLARALKDFPP